MHKKDSNILTSIISHDNLANMMQQSVLVLVVSSAVFLVDTAPAKKEEDKGLSSDIVHVGKLPFLVYHFLLLCIFQLLLIGLTVRIRSLTYRFRGCDRAIVENHLLSSHCPRVGQVCLL